MRRIGLILSSLVTVGMLVTAGVAQACPGEAAHECGCNKARAAQQAQNEKKQDKKAQPEAAKDGAQAPGCGCGGACTHGQELNAPKSNKQGSLDDRLIRPHRSWDASAGILG